jgi:hypothetical protein
MLQQFQQTSLKAVVIWFEILPLYTETSNSDIPLVANCNLRVFFHIQMFAEASADSSCLFTDS